mgnify:CR=1 FL=1
MIRRAVTARPITAMPHSPEPNLRVRAQGALLRGLGGHGITSETQGIDRHLALQLIHMLMQPLSTYAVDIAKGMIKH